ncbi:MAG: hypothetical protein M3283_03620 [Actinomycetota bacterium]|nr:hypothetical protein [Actinomycetota bacterium]
MQNLMIPVGTNRSLRLANLHDAEKVRGLIRENLTDLKTILRWNAEHGISLFRMGQSLIPFASHPEFPFDWEKVHGDELGEAGELSRALGIRLSMHPGQYIQPPRVVFSDPEIAATGLSEEQARQQGMDVATVALELPKVLARPVTYEKEPRGNLGLLADRERRLLVGAWAVAPLTGEWIHQALLAIKTCTPIDALLDSVFQFPTLSQGYLEALEKLDL